MPNSENRINFSMKNGSNILFIFNLPKKHKISCKCYIVKKNLNIMPPITNRSKFSWTQSPSDHAQHQRRIP